MPLDVTVDLSTSGVATEKTLYELKKALADIEFTVKTVEASENTNGVTVTLEKGSKHLVEWHVYVSGPAEIYIEVSLDGENWFQTPNKRIMSSEGSWHDWDFIAFPFVRVRVPTRNVAVLVLIVASP